MRAAARYLRFYGAAVNHMTGQTIPVEGTGLDLTLREPFGGYGQSGLGKEQGLEGLYDFTEVKNTYVSDR